jgi:hypothetical protein
MSDESPRWHIGAPMMPDLAAELARVVTLWSRLESMMNGLICQLSGIGLSLGDLFLGTIAMPARFLVLEAVATRYLSEKDPDLCRSIIKLGERIRKYQKRNHLVHGLWIRGGFDFAITHQTVRKSNKRESVRWTLEEIKEVGDDISTLIINLWALIERVDELFPQPPAQHLPWRRKPPLRPPRALQRLGRSR